MKSDDPKSPFETDLQKAFDIRKRNFTSDIYFFAPSLKRYETTEFSNTGKPVFVPVSLTGPSCSLNCKHCGGKLLESMYAAYSEEELYSLASKLHDEGIEGLLITGGSCVDGTVPMKPFFPALRKIKKKLQLKLAAHTGIVDKETAAEMKGIFDAAMLDIIGNEETINEVYNLERTPADFYKTVENLIEQDIDVVPHILLGLHYGEIRGEYDALKKLINYELAALVLIIIEKLKGTVFYEMRIQPPSIQQIRELFVFTRVNFAATPLLVGCARPGGAMEREIDILAVNTGFNGIAYPAEEAIIHARNIGLTPRYSEYCCAFLFQMI
jgi:uncharacterized radical SAM superfamily protein